MGLSPCMLLWASKKPAPHSKKKPLLNDLEKISRGFLGVLRIRPKEGHSPLLGWMFVPLLLMKVWGSEICISSMMHGG
jgi:hypothetical protein